jgi:hypothetical protein
MNRTALIITPYFPPVAASGAKRPLHLVRNLPAFGWRPIVLASPSEDGPGDVDLAAAIPPDTVVSRGYWSGLREKRAPDAAQVPGPSAPAKPKAPPGRLARLTKSNRWKYLTPFDRFLADTPHGVREALRLIDEHRPSLIHVIADPWSVFTAGDALRTLTGLPLVVDLRDPWSCHEGKMALRPAVSQAILRAYERRIFQRSAAVVLNTEAARDCYAEAYAGVIPAERFHFVRNAFDEGLFDRAPDLPPEPVFTVMYFGTFRLFVEPEGLLRAFKRFVDDHAVAPGTARLRFVGGLRPEDHARIAEMGLTPFVDAVKSVPFRKSVGLLRQADVLSLVIQPDCTLQIPGKLYDYLGARRFILALSANTEVNALLERTGAGAGIPWGDEAAAAAVLGRLYARKRQSGRVELGADVDLEPFSARSQARAMATIYEGALRAGT